MANRKQKLAKALTEDARLQRERSQGVVKAESGSMAFSTGQSASTVGSNIDPTMAAILETWVKGNKKK